MAAIGVHEHTVGKWRRRFLKERLRMASAGTAAADDRQGCRADAQRDAGGRHPLVAADGQGKRPFAHAIWRIWGAFGLQPHRSETFKRPAIRTSWTSATS